MGGMLMTHTDGYLKIILLMKHVVVIMHWAGIVVFYILIL